MMGFVF